MSLRFPVAPMKASLGTLPHDDEGWAFEIKWDGHRTLAHVDGGHVRLQTTSGKDSSGRWPEVASIAGAINAESAIVDGEMLVIGEDGRPSFDLVQRRDPSRHPALFHVFDVLSVNGTDTVGLPYIDRRSLLAELIEPGDHWAVPTHQLGGGADLLSATVEQELEGLIAKRIDSTYRPGTRSTDWLKIKNRRTVEVTIGGYTAGAGNRSSTFGSLLVGLETDDADAPLRFAGGVGTGFTHTVLETLTERLRSIETDDCPFTPPPPAAVRRAARWVEPLLRAQLEIAEFTNEGLVRHASFIDLVE